MHTTLSLIAIGAHVASITRLVAYRRDGARHRHHVSWVAWLLLVVMGQSAIELALGTRSACIFDTAAALLLALFVFGARGNVARLI